MVQTRGAGAGVEAVCLLGSIAASVLLAASALLNRADFFLHDDFRTYFLPMFREMSRLLLSGEFPLLTDRLWYGGAILAEYQFGVLNPVGLGLATLVGQMPDLAAASAVYALSHIAILAGGAYALCRMLKCGRSTAFLAALVAPTSEWIFYWGAGNWIPALTSLAWAPWAWAALIATSRDARWTPIAAAAVALVLLSGWPFANLALLISVVVVQAAIGRRIPWPSALAVACGGLLSAPAVLPLVAYLHGANRPVAPMLMTNFDALIGISTPFMTTRWRAFGGATDVVIMPMLQASWFIAPALVMAAWRPLWRRPEVRALSMLAVIYGAVSVMPGLWQFRWMFRLLPYYQLALTILAVLAIDEALHAGRTWRPMLVAIVIALPLWLVLWQDTRLTTFYLAAALVLTLFASLAVWIQPQRGPVFVAALALGHAALFVLVNTTYLGVGSRYPREMPLPTRVAAAGEPALTRHVIFTLDDRASTWNFVHPGDSALERPGVTVVGYSPFHRPSYEEPLCLSALGSANCSDAVARLTAPFDGTGISFLDLARIEELRTVGPQRAREFARSRPDWTRRDRKMAYSIFQRPRGFALPAPLSAAPPDAAFGRVRATPRAVRLPIESLTGGRVILARAWYPGWRAALDGRPLKLQPVGGVFVAAELPPGTKGELAFSYWPAGLSVGLVAAALGTVLLAVGTIILRRAKEGAHLKGRGAVIEEGSQEGHRLSTSQPAASSRAPPRSAPQS